MGDDVGAAAGDGVLVGVTDDVGDGVGEAVLDGVGKAVVGGVGVSPFSTMIEVCCDGVLESELTVMGKAGSRWSVLDPIATSSDWSSEKVHDDIAPAKTVANTQIATVTIPICELSCHLGIIRMMVRGSSECIEFGA